MLFSDYCPFCSYLIDCPCSVGLVSLRSTSEMCRFIGQTTKRPWAWFSISPTTVCSEASSLNILSYCSTFHSASLQGITGRGLGCSLSRCVLSTGEVLSVPSLPLSFTHWVDGRAEARMAALSGQLEQGVTYTKFFKVPDVFGILLFSRKLYFPDKNDF